MRVTAGGDFSGLLLRASDSEFEPSGQGGSRSGRDLRIVEDVSGMEGSLRRRTTSGKLDVAEADCGKVGCDGSRLRESWTWRKLISEKLDVADMVSDLGVFATRVAPGRAGEEEDPGWIHGLVDVSRKALGSLDTCHHHDHGQTLTTTLTN